MGSKYTTQASSGYNSSPPPDDGSQNASNLITWSGIKTKIGDPTKNLADAINTALVAAFDYSVRQITTSDTIVASDHMKTVEIAPTATSGVTVTLSDATTMTNNFRVFVKNSSAVQQTIARATVGDTIDGTAANITIPPKSGYLFQTTTGADGYLIIGDYPFEITNLTEDTAPAVSDLVATYDLSASSLKKVTLQSFFKSVNGLTEDTSPDLAADYVVTYDASASASKKVLLGRVGSGVLATRQASTSGTAIDFTNIPAWAKKIIIQFVGVSTSGVDNWLVQIGDSGGIKNTGYLGACSSNGTTVANSTAGFIITISTSSAVAHGQIILAMQDASTFTWTASGSIARSDSAVMFNLAGSKSTSAALDRVRITTTGGTDTFDAGSINILYE